MTESTGTHGCDEPPAVVEPVGIPDDDTLATLAKAVAHPARIRILRCLAERRACSTGELVTELDLAQSTVSEHLRILREAGLVHGEIDGPRTRYRLDPDRLTALVGGVDALVRIPAAVHG